MLYKVRIKAFITFEETDRNPNPFRIFNRVLCSIYRQKFIEIRGSTWEVSFVSGNCELDIELPASLVDGIICNFEALSLEWRRRFTMKLLIAKMQ